MAECIVGGISGSSQKIACGFIGQIDGNTTVSISSYGFKEPPIVVVTLCSPSNVVPCSVSSVTKDSFRIDVGGSNDGAYWVAIGT